MKCNVKAVCLIFRKTSRKKNSSAMYLLHIKENSILSYNKFANNFKWIFCYVLPVLPEKFAGCWLLRAIEIIHVIF